MTVYREQREQEWIERKAKQEEEEVVRQVVVEQKQRLLEEYASLLQEFNPKAAS